MLLRVLLACWLVTVAHWTAIAQANEPDFSTWQHMPVFYNGRMMPVNTFARMAVESVCNRANPYLDLEGVSDEARDLPEFDETQKMFPDGRRKFTSAEILFSWMVEPERWEYVPFLIGEHEELREEILGLPVLSSKDKHFKYVSPHDLEESKGFAEAIEALIKKQRSTPREDLDLTTAEIATEQLYRAYMTFRSIAYDPFSSEPRKFTVKLSDTVDLWNDAAKAWGASRSELTALSPPAYEANVDEQIEAVRSSLHSLTEISSQGSVDPCRAEEILTSAQQQATDLAGTADRGTKEIFKRDRPEGQSESDWKQLRSQAHLISSRATDLVTAIMRARLALYDSGRSIRLLPGLNPAALEKNREAGDDAQPWVSLPTILFSGDDVYRDFVRPDLPKVDQAPIYPDEMSRLEYLQRLAAEGNPARTDRVAFAEAAAAYMDRGASDRPKRFAEAMDRFAADVRALGESIESARAELELRHPDDELIELTAYPAPGATDVEVHYYQLDPFKWSWIVSFLSLCFLGAAFGAIRKPMYWTGIFFLVVGQAFSIYGLALRTYVTGWAPVTNMFETVVFVALVTAVLGLCFAVMPLFGPGFRRAWRLTAIPGTPEAGLDENDLAAMSQGTWTGTRLVLLVPRIVLIGLVFYVLTGIQYGAGTGYSAIRLVPRGDSINDQVVWAVGLSMLAIALWLIPRMAIAALLSFLTLPWSLAQSGLAKPMQKSVERKTFAMVGAGTACVVGLIAYYAPMLYADIWDKDIKSLMPVLRDNFWLTLHVLSITASYGAGFLAWGLGITAMTYYIFGRYRAPLAPSQEHVQQGHRPAHGYQAPPEAFHRRVPEPCVSLSGFIYKALQVAVVLLAAGTILGGLWADVSWGRFWGWDSKEVWALISLLIYVGILHFRFIGVLRDFALAAGAILAITSIVMAWWGVNFFLGSGMHSYGDGAGGGSFVLGFMLFNCVVVAVGAIRYLAETGRAATPVQQDPAQSKTAAKSQ
jgi:ABC-type transport system involved in cytochrome c biogenesis permease subunit